MAIIIKRQSVEDIGEDRREVLTEVQQIITGGNMQMVSSYIFVNWKFLLTELSVNAFLLLVGSVFSPHNVIFIVVSVCRATCMLVSSIS